MALGSVAADSLGEVAAVAAVDEKVWNFRVLLDDRDIGRHEFRVSRPGERERIRIEADFDVKILFIRAYQYDHVNTETWTGGCLQSIESVTDDNGEQYAVRGEDVGETFTLDLGNGPASLDIDCLQTYAYWNPGILKADALLNSQTGDVESVSVLRVGEEQIAIAGETVLADRFDLKTDRGDITLWYCQEGQRWLALETLARGDRLLRYEALTIPPVPDRVALN